MTPTGRAYAGGKDQKRDEHRADPAGRREDCFAHAQIPGRSEDRPSL